MVQILAVHIVGLIHGLGDQLRGPLGELLERAVERFAVGGRQDFRESTGKVERAHQIIEEFEKLLGCCVDPPGTVEALNLFAQRFCDHQ